MPRTLALACSAAMSLALLAAPPAGAAPAAEPSVAPAPRANVFPERYSVKAAGDLVITGNTLLTCSTAVSTCASARSATGSKSLNNNDYTMIMVDIDSDASTPNSSTADLRIPDRAPVLFAGLYWGAGASGDQAKGYAPANADRVKFKVPGDASYRSLTADRYSPIATKGSNKTYTAFTDVTSVVRTVGRGTYAVADVKTDLGTNHFAGWSLVVVYGDPTEPVRAISVYDGVADVTSDRPATIDVEGFLTPPTGPVRTALGMVAYEGDLGLTGDKFTLNGRALSDSIRSGTNFWNSTITTKTGHFTAKSPDYRNQLGFDAGLVDATGRIANNATRATFQASSEGDQYYPAVLTFSTELFAPRYAAVKSVVDVNGDVVRPGDELLYTLTLKNDVTAENGDASQGTVISDVLPTGATYTPGSLVIDGQSVPDSGSVATVEPGRLTVRVGAGASATTGGRLAVGASTTISYRMTVDASTPGGTVLANDFTVAGRAATSGFEVSGISNEAAVTVVANGADLSIVKTAVDQEPSIPGTVFYAGRDATYTIAVTNAGPGSAENVVVDDTLPAGTSFVSAEGTGWACAEESSRLQCSRARLASGATASTITVKVSVDADAPTGTAVTNRASVTSETPDPNPDDNTSTSTGTVERLADLAIAKEHVGDAVVGQEITYAISVRNNGPSQATGVTVVDTLSDSLQFVSAEGDGWTCTSEIRCTLSAPLEPGETAPGISLVATVLTAEGSSLANTATVSGNEKDPTPSNNTATDDSRRVRLVDVVESLTHPGKAVAGGPPVPVLVRAYNAGPAAIPTGSTVTQTVTIPPGTSMTGYSGAGWSCSPETATATDTPEVIACSRELTAPWEPGTRVTDLTVDVAVAAGETDDKTVSSVVSNDSGVLEIDTDNNRASDVITVESLADLQIATTSSASLVAGGASAPLTFTVTNNGPSVDPGPFTVRFSQLHDLALDAAPGSPWTCTTADEKVTCTLDSGSLPAGQSLPPIVLEVSAPNEEQLPGSFDLTAIVSSPTPDSNPDNDVTTAPITVTNVADIWTAKSAQPTSIRAGDTVTYTLTVSNGAPYGGPSAARDVFLVDDLTAIGLVVESITVVEGTLDCGASNDSLVSCYTPMLRKGERGVVTVVARTDPAWSEPGRVTTNSASATSSTPGGERPPAEVDITTDPYSSLSLRKSVRDAAEGERLVPGSTVIYDLRVTNEGPSDGAGATVVDELPTTLTPLVAVGEGWSCEIDGQRISCTTDQEIPVGAMLPLLSIKALLATSTSGDLVNSATVTPSSPGEGDTDEVTNPVEDVIDLDVAHFGPYRLQAGDTWETKVQVRNNGPADEPGPLEVVIGQEGGARPIDREVSGPGWDCSVDGSQAMCTHPGPLPFGDSLPSISITSTTPPRGTQVDSQAKVTGSREETDRSNNVSETSAILVRSADIAVIKEAVTPVVRPGDVAYYVLHLVNNGPGATSDAQVRDALPPGLTWIPEESDGRCANETSAVVCNAEGTLGAGEETTFVIATRVSDSVLGPIRNTARGDSSQPDPDPDNNTDRTTIEVVDDPDEADIEVTKSADRSKASPGQRVKFTITLTNNGPDTATGSMARDVLPNQLMWDADESDSRCEQDGDAIACAAGTLSPGESTSFTIAAVVAKGATGQATNVAYGESDLPDPDPDNNTDESTVNITDKGRQEQVPTTQPPDKIRDSGKTVIYNKPPKTNAGQRAYVTVTCAPRGVQTRGDVDYCRVIRKPNGKLLIDVPGTTALRITVRVTAPAVPGYRAMDIVYEYTTSKA